MHIIWDRKHNEPKARSKIGARVFSLEWTLYGFQCMWISCYLVMIVLWRVTNGLFCSTPGVAVARAVPRKIALQMLFTGQPISAQGQCMVIWVYQNCHNNIHLKLTNHSVITWNSGSKWRHVKEGLISSLYGKILNLMGMWRVSNQCPSLLLRAFVLPRPPLTDYQWPPCCMYDVCYECSFELLCAT